MRIIHLSIPFLGMGAKPFGLEIPSMGIAYAEPGEYSVMHKHMSCEVHFVKSGELDLRIASQSIQLRNGTVFFVNAGVEHEQRFIRKSIVYYFPLIVSQYSTASSAVRNKNSDMQDNSPTAQILASSWCMAPSTKLIRQCFERIRYAAGMRRLKTDSNPLNECFATLMNSFVQCISRNDIEKSLNHWTNLTHTDSETRNTLLQAIQYMEHNFAGSLRMADIAHEACMSIRNFYRQFRKAVGQTPLEYLMEIRLRKCLVLLRETDTKIDAIMEMCGFRSREHFYKYFSQRIGTTPESYRRNSTRPVSFFGQK